MPKVGVGKGTAAVLAGEGNLAEWSDEELIRGQRRDRRGTWGGRPPSVVPAAIHHELVKRRLGRAGQLLNESLVDAVSLLRQVVTDDGADYGDRIKAANIIIERVMGKAPVHVNVTHEPPWAQALKAAIGSPDEVEIVEGDETAEYLDAESWEDGSDDAADE